MTSYTKQLRAGKGTIAALSRENLDPAAVPAETEMTPEAASAVLAEPVAQEIEQDVLAPAEQIEQGTDALMEAEADAGLLENTAQILEDASGDGVADVDVATPELANITVERIAAKYGMARTAVLSKESLGAAASRVETTRFISKEAFEKAGELRKRVSEGVAKLIEWFKNLIKNIFDKRTKLEKRFQAILATAKTKDGYVAKEGAKIKVDSVLLNSKIDDVINVLGGFKEIAEIAGVNAAEMEGMGSRPEFDFNPNKLGGIELKASVTDGKLVVVKTSADAPASEEIDPVDLSRVRHMAATGLDLLKDLKTAEAELNKTTASMGTTAQKLKALATGEDNGAGASRGAILARYQGVTTLAGALSTIVLRFLTSVSLACEQTLAVYEAPAAA